MLLDFLGFEGRLGQAFLYNGGLETIQSYGISVFDPPEEMLKALPAAHLTFFKNLDSIVLYKEFVLVHAGLHPLRDLSAQNDSDIFWIRDDFIHNVHPFGKTIVFGHTPHPEVFEHLPFKLGIDTGLVFRNKLTCIELPSGEVYQVARNDTQVRTRRLDMSKRFQKAK
jgi:serine/threonine protein phosphatase 1